MLSKHWSIYFIIIMLLSACTPAAKTSTPSPIPDATPTNIPPTDTPTPSAQKIWVVLGGALPEQTIRTVVESADRLAKSSGMTLEQKPVLDLNELAGQVNEVKAIIVLPPDPGVAELANQYKQIRFITVMIPGLTQQDNLYMTTTGSDHPEWEGFLGGYVAALVTSDWRIGMITEADSPNGSAAADGFVNGGVFYCGLCNPQFPPFVDYPYTRSLHQNAPQSEWQTTADEIIASGVTTVYIYPSVAIPEMVAYLAQNNLRIISGEPVIEQLRPAYIATIQQSSSNALELAIQDALDGKAPGTYSSQLTVQPVDSSLLSEGKMRLVNQVVSGLLDGTVRAKTGE